MSNTTNRDLTARATRRGVLVAAVALGLLFSTAPRTARAADASASLVDEARTRMRKRDLRGALAALGKAIDADPRNADAHILYQDLGREAVGLETLTTAYRQKAGEKPDDPLLAFLYTRLLPPDEELRDFEKMIQKFPASPWPHVGRARALEALGRGAETGPDYDAAVAAAPSEVRFKAYQAYGLERIGNWVLAAPAWKSVLTATPNDRAARLGYGEALRKTGVYDEAITVFADCIKADANDFEAHYRIGLTNLDAGKVDDALKSFDAALAIDRTFVEAYCAATEASIQKTLDTVEKEKRDPTEKDFEKAIAYGGKAAAVGSDRADAHFANAAAHEAAGELALSHYDMAAVEYDAALNLLVQPTPEKVRALCGKAFVLLRLQKWDQALTCADKALGIDDKCIAAYAHAGFALAAQGHQDDAIKKYYRPGLKIAPDDARLHHALGVALWETVHDADAKKELEAAVKAEPDNARYRLTLGQIYYDLKAYRPAAEQLYRVVDARPNDLEAWRSYGRVCSALKDWDQAVESYEKICAILETPKPVPPPAPGAAPAPAPQTAATSADDDLLKKSHLYLAIIFSDHLKKRDKAKEHAKKFVSLGGSDPNLDSFINDLLSDK